MNTNKTKSEQQIEDDLISIILNHFSQETNVPILLFDKERQDFVALDWNCLSDYCQEMFANKKLVSTCINDHRNRANRIKEKVLEECHIGLWNLTYPIKVGGKIVAVLICGQRMICEREDKSLPLLDRFLNRHDIPEEEQRRLFDLYTSLPCETSDDFEEMVLEQVVKIAELIYQLKKDRILRQKEEKNRRSKINNLVHEILLPMQSITSNVENIMVELDSKEYEFTKEQLVQAAKFVYTQINILGMHTENVQKSLMGEMELEYVFKTHSIYRIFKECNELFNIVARRKGIQLSIPQLINLDIFPEIEMSYPDLLRAFKNLFHNAVKYSYRGIVDRERWISTKISKKSNDYIKIEISNYGVGIKENELQSVFLEGKRGDLSIDRHRTGSGLGLALVKRIIENHNGSISIDSKKKGGPYKTTVIVELPYKQGKGVKRYGQNLEDSVG